jgi:hypothetical protein
MICSVSCTVCTRVVRMYKLVGWIVGWSIARKLEARFLYVSRKKHLHYPHNESNNTATTTRDQTNVVMLYRHTSLLFVSYIHPELVAAGHQIKHATVSTTLLRHYSKLHRRSMVHSTRTPQTSNAVPFLNPNPNCHYEGGTVPHTVSRVREWYR